jgi:hypothetical protein
VTQADRPGQSRLLDQLDAITAAHPVDRKFLVGPDINFGRELLVALGRRRGGWIGWETATLRVIADELALLELARRGVRSGDDVTIGALIDQALDTCVAQHQVTAAFADVAHGPGFRTLLRDAILELRMEGVTADEFPRGAPADSIRVPRPCRRSPDIKDVTLFACPRRQQAHGPICPTRFASLITVSLFMANTCESTRG